jgi:hypothetical protein
MSLSPAFNDRFVKVFGELGFRRTGAGRYHEPLRPQVFGSSLRDLVDDMAVGLDEDHRAVLALWALRLTSVASEFRCP